MHISSALAISVLATVITTITAAPLDCTLPPEPYISFTPPTASAPAPVHRLFNISNYGFENLAPRANGQILVTAAFGPSAGLWQIDPVSILPPILLHSFPSLTSTLGITELAPDMFYVAATNSSQRGSAAVFSVNMRPFRALPNGTVSTPAIIRKVANLTSAGGPNGIAHIRNTDDFVLVADTALGGIWKTNIVSGVSSLIIQDPSMKGPPNTTGPAAYGINGIRVHNDTLFYTNSGALSLYRMPIHINGSSAGSPKVVTSQISCDDFAIDRRGDIYVASPSNALIRVDSQTGKQMVVAGTFNSTTSNIIGASSVQFGRGASDSSSVYVTTNGGSFTCAPPGSQGISRVDVGDLAQVSG